MGHKLLIRVVDISLTATAAEVEQQLNAVCDEGYYSDKILLANLPEGVGLRGIFKLRMKP